MILRRQRNRASLKPRRAFTMVEVVGSVMIVSVTALGVMRLVGVSTASTLRTGDRALGHLLAQQLMTEILQQDYRDPDDPIPFGREPGEAAASRADYDDVDDYDNWSAPKVQNKSGVATLEQERWVRVVNVDFVRPDDLMKTVESDLGVKRITVKVLHRDVEVASLVAIRTAPSGFVLTYDPVAGP